MFHCRTSRRLPHLLTVVMAVTLCAGLLLAQPSPARASTPLGGTGIGDLPGYTQLASRLSDLVSVEVNVGTGDLELRSTDLHTRGTGLDYTLTRTYNSRATSVGAFGNATSMSNGADVRLTTGSGGVVTYTAPSGFTAAYTPNGATAYTSPGAYQQANLVKTGSGWTLTFHNSNEKLTFNTAGQLLSDADRNGNANTFGYNTDGTLHQVLDTQGRVTAFNYANGLITSTTDPSGRHTLYAYDSTGDLTKVTDPTGAVWAFSYWEGNSNLDQIVDRRGNSETFSYDSAHRVTKATYAAYTKTAATITYAYNGSSTTVTDPNSNTATYTLDSSSRVTNSYDALNNSRGITYDAVTGNVATATDPSSAIRQFTYKTTGQLNSAQEPAESNGTGSTPGAKTVFNYDNTAQPNQASQVTDAQGNQTRYGYDPAGNPTTTASYTSSGQPTSSQNTTTRAYQGDPAAGGGTTSCGARPGELCTSTDPRGILTAYSYDSHGNLTAITTPAPLGKTSYGYDSLSRVTSVTDAKNQSTTVAYDADDRITSTTTAGAVTTYTYDASGNLTARADSTGKTTYSYDPAGHLTNQGAPNSWGRTYTYDLAGNLTSSSDSGGPAGTTTYTYDPANEIKTVVDPTGATTTISYTKTRQTAITYPGNVTQTWAYDAAGRPVHTTATSGSTTLLDQTGSYAQANGSDQELLQTLRDTTAGTSTAYTYDTLNRLIEAATTGTTSGDYRYLLDPDGNRTQAVTNGAYTAVDTFNNASQLINRGGAAFGGYDPDGNATSDGTGQAYAYNPTNQTTAITPPGQATLAASYSDTDQAQRLILGATTSVNGTLGVDQDTTNGQTTYYTRQPDGQPVNERTPGGTYYYLYNLHGDVAALTSTAGTRIDSYTYDPYGNTTSPNSAAPVANPFRYDAAYFDTTTGLYHLAARYYDPKLGRFTQPDPSGQEANTYLYSDADPVNLSDRSGQNAVDCVTGYVAFGGALLSGAGAAISAISTPLTTAAGAAAFLGFGGATLGLVAEGFSQESQCSSKL